MNPEKFALPSARRVFGGALGLVLHRILPEKHVTGGAKDMIGAVVGLLTLLSALVLGLLIWTAYGVYAGQKPRSRPLPPKSCNSMTPYRTTGRRRTARERNCDKVWPRRSTELGLRSKATPISPPTTSPRRSKHAQQGGALEASSRRRMHRRGRSLRRRRPSTRSASRDCRCPSRWPALSPFRSS